MCGAAVAVPVHSASQAMCRVVCSACNLAAVLQLTAVLDVLVELGETTLDTCGDVEMDTALTHTQGIAGLLSARCDSRQGCCNVRVLGSLSEQKQGKSPWAQTAKCSSREAFEHRARQ